MEECSGMQKQIGVRGRAEARNVGKVCAGTYSLYICPALPCRASPTLPSLTPRQKCCSIQVRINDECERANVTCM